MKGTLFKVTVNGFEIQFQADSGSDVSLLSRKNLQDLENYLKTKIPLKKVTKKFRAANFTSINFDGYFIAKLKTLSGQTCSTEMHVLNIPPNEASLLGETDLLNLGLICYHPNGSFVKSITKYPEPTIATDDPIWIKKFKDLHSKHKKVFQGMGLLKGYEAELQLTDDAVEFYQKPKPVAIHLIDQVTARLQEYIKSGLFEHVPPNEPILFCSRLLIIEEKNSKLRLVGDYRQLNKYLRRHVVMPAPRVEDFISKMRGAKYFLKTEG